MPLIVIPGPLTVRFYSSDCSEPIHVHVRVEQASCKVWLNDWKVVKIKGFKDHQISKVIRILKSIESLIRKVWHEHCFETEDQSE